MAYQMHTYAGDFRAFKGLIAAQYAGVEVEFDQSFTMGKDNKTKEFLAMSPMGKVPVLSTPKGALLESNAIARFLARHAAAAELMGCSFFEQAQVESWLDWCSNELEVPVTMWIYPLFQFMPPNPKQVNKATKETKEALKVLEAHLLSRSFVVGNAVTLADIALVSTLTYPMKMVFDMNFRRNFPSITRWFMTCIALPEFAAVTGDVLLCTKAMALPKNKNQGKKKQKQPKKKAAPKPKPKKPTKPQWITNIQGLEKSPFSLDDWKTRYSNCRTQESMQTELDWFWANVDKAGWSVWRTTKAKSDAAYDKVGFVTCNSMNAFVQRMIEVQKYCFGTLAVTDTLAELGNLSTVGAFLFRGQDNTGFCKVNPEMSLEPPVHDMVKLDWAAPETKAYVNECWLAGQNARQWGPMAAKVVEDGAVCFK